MDDLLHVLRILFHVVWHVLVFFFGKLGMASTSFMILKSCKMTTFPRIKPMRECETIDIKDVPKIRGCPALNAEENTMSSLSDPMMLTLFIASPE
jgi:hypothetical protein